MLVRLLQEYSFADGPALPAGSVVSTDDDEAARLIFDGVAVPMTRREFERAMYGEVR